MKKYMLLKILFVLTTLHSHCQVTIIQNISTSDSITNHGSLVKYIPDVRFTGVGNLLTNSDGGFNQSGSISGEFNLGTNKQWMVMMGFNLGNKLDSTYRDSTGLKDIFYPDRSRIGFHGLISWDVLRSKNVFKLKKDGKTLWNLPNTMNLNNVNVNETNKIAYWQVLPTFELSYQNRNFVDIDSLPTNKIENLTALAGCRLWYKIHVDKNIFGFTGYFYWKQQTISEGTLSTYRALYDKENNGQSLTPQATFLGASLGLLINDALITFTYENLQTKEILAPGVSGGVFLVKFSLGAKFMEF